MSNLDEYKEKISKLEALLKSLDDHSLDALSSMVQIEKLRRMV